MAMTTIQLLLAAAEDEVMVKIWELKYPVNYVRTFF
jgi:hypothetical protein